MKNKLKKSYNKFQKQISRLNKAIDDKKWEIFEKTMIDNSFGVPAGGASQTCLEAMKKIK